MGKKRIQPVLQHKKAGNADERGRERERGGGKREGGIERRPVIFKPFSPGLKIGFKETGNHGSGTFWAAK